MVRSKFFLPLSLEGWRKLLGLTVKQWNATLLLFKEVGTLKKNSEEKYRLFYAQHEHSRVPNTAKQMRPAEWKKLIELLKEVRLLETVRSKKTGQLFARFLVDPTNIPDTHRSFFAAMRTSVGNSTQSRPKRPRSKSIKREQFLAALRRDFPDGEFRTGELDEGQYDFENRRAMLQSLNGCAAKGLLRREGYGHYQFVSDSEEGK